MSDLGNAAISDSGDGAMLASVVEKWPVDPRQAGDAIRQYRTMTFFAIALEGVTGLIILALAMITLLRAWETLGFLTIHAAAGYLLLLAAALILLKISRQFRIRRCLRSITGNLSEHGTSTCPRCGTVPFAAASCCRLAPEGWSRLDLHGFWHEIAAKRGDPPAGWTRILRDAGMTRLRPRAGIKRTKNAWKRARGPLGTSLRYPRAKPVQQSIRWILGWWQMAWPLVFVPLAVWTAAPLITRGAPIGTAELILPGIFGLTAIWGVYTAIRQRQSMTPVGGTTLPRCTRCGYRLHPPFLDRCPECGKNLGERDSVSLLPQSPAND